MRLELNLPALERLIGGDTEIEIALRNQIVQEFARRHLKALLNDLATKRMFEIWNQEIQAAIDSTLKELKAAREAKLEDGTAITNRMYDIQKAMDDAVRRSVDKSIASVIEGREAFYVRMVDERIKAVIWKQVDKEIEIGIKRTIEAAAKSVTEVG